MGWLPEAGFLEACASSRQSPTPHKPAVVRDQSHSPSPNKFKPPVREGTRIAQGGVRRSGRNPGLVCLKSHLRPVGPDRTVKGTKSQKPTGAPAAVAELPTAEPGCPRPALVPL